MLLPDRPVLRLWRFAGLSGGIGDVVPDVNRGAVCALSVRKYSAPVLDGAQEGEAFRAVAKRFVLFVFSVFSVF